MRLHPPAAETHQPAQACHAEANYPVEENHSAQSSHHAERNRANAQHSTGPKTVHGKIRSSQNSFRHGLYSKQLVLPNEDPAEFDHLRAALRREHQPASTTEEILVDELAQHFWRMRRFRESEARAFQPENLDAWIANGLLALIARSAASAERSFHKSLHALRLLQKARGFVPATVAPEEKHGMPAGHTVEIDWEDDESGFVPQDALSLLLQTDSPALYQRALHQRDLHEEALHSRDRHRPLSATEPHPDSALI